MDAKVTEVIKKAGMNKQCNIQANDKDIANLSEEVAAILIGDKKFKTLHFNFKSSDKTLPENKKLNTDIWYEEDTFLWVKAAFDKRGYWEYRIKQYN